MECLSCRADLPEDSRFCDECGTPMPVSCPSCAASNRPGAKFCAKCGSKLAPDPSAVISTASPVPQAFPSTSPAERRQLTVMFCDLVGSTALASRLDPEDLRTIIGDYQRCCAAVIETGGGYVRQYMGDGGLCY